MGIKLAIVGGRDYDDYEGMVQSLEPYSSKVDGVVSGEAPGADTLGERWCREILKKEPETYPALWDDLTKTPCRIKYRKNGKPYNVLAGFNRNKDIISNADCVAAFWDGKSPGTKNSIDLCKEYNKPLKIFYYESKTT